MQALGRAVEHVQRRLVSELPQRFRNFVLDFLLVERAGQRGLVGRCIRLLGFLPPVVENDDIQFAHVVARL
jgi:hypothetical protein